MTYQIRCNMFAAILDQVVRSHTKSFASPTLISQLSIRNSFVIGNSTFVISHHNGSFSATRIAAIVVDVLLVLRT